MDIALSSLGKNHRKLMLNNCVYNETELRTAITAAPDNVLTIIDICVSIMNIIANIANPKYQGINIENRA